MVYAVKKQKPKQKPEQEEDSTAQAFLREVDEALHEERLLTLWQKWQGVIIAALVLLFLTVGAWEFYKSYHASALESQANAWYAADDALVADLATSGDAGYATMALFKQAATLSGQGQVKQAAALFLTVTENTAVPALYQDLARLNAGLVLMQSDPAQAETHFATLQSRQSPFKATAVDMMAQLAENRADNATAIGLYESLLEMQTAPASMKTRALERISLIKSQVN